MTGSSDSIHRLWVFSDLHLTNPDSTLYLSFLKALEEPNSAQDCVVFAGDIFDIFVGKSAHFREKHAPFLKAVQHLSQKNVQLYYIQGNHDFHLASAFSNTSVQFLDSELILGKIYIAHGDLVDRSDHGYLLMRKLFRAQGFQKLVELLPGKTIEKIAEAISRPHDQKEKDLYASGSGSIPPVRSIYRAFAEEKKRQGFDFIILGHCHDLDEIQPFYFNMGYPPVHRQFLFYSAESNSFQRRLFL